MVLVPAGAIRLILIPPCHTRLECHHHMIHIITSAHHTSCASSSHHILMPLHCRYLPVHTKPTLCADTDALKKACIERPSSWTHPAGSIMSMMKDTIRAEVRVCARMFSGQGGRGRDLTLCHHLSPSCFVSYQALHPCKHAVRHGHDDGTVHSFLFFAQDAFLKWSREHNFSSPSL